MKDTLKVDAVLKYHDVDLALNFGLMTPAEGSIAVMLVRIQGNAWMLLIVVNFGHKVVFKDFLASPEAWVTQSSL